jgi:2'-5' RNA ligase
VAAVQEPTNLPEYIVILWPSVEYAERIEAYRRGICRACDAKTTLAWPAHMSLHYGIRTADIDAVAIALRRLARETVAVWLTVKGLGAFPEGTLYLAIAPSPELSALQASVRNIVGDIVHKCGGHVTAAQLKNCNEWGSIYPPVPHITLASHLALEQRESALSEAQRLLATLPHTILADRMSLAVFDATSGISETIEAFSLATKEQA